MQGNINMNANRIAYIPDPLSNNEPVTKQYGDRTYLTDSGFVMNDNIGMNDHMITNLGTPTDGTDAANKKYVDDKKCKFKDGTTTTDVVDLRHDSINNRFTLSMRSDASSVELTISFKNDLLTGVYSFSFDVFFTTTLECKIFLYGECGGTGFNATTWYRHVTSNSTVNVTQDNADGGYFHRADGRNSYIGGSFWNYGTSVVNYGKAYSLANDGRLHDFVIQKLVVKPTESKFLGMSMSWIFENVTAGNGVTLESESLFVITKVQ